ncbi:MAG: M2 family metallopeptidase [Bacillota bacterium]
MSRDGAIQQVIDRILPRAQELMIQMSYASWEQNTAGTAEAAQKAAQIGRELKSYFADPTVFAELKLLKEAGGAEDPRLNRQLAQLYRSYLANQISPEEIAETVERENELRQLFATFRATYQGRQISDNELGEVFRSESDSAKRQEAWLASKQIGAQAAEKVRELARLRNRIARRLGFRDYFDMVLQSQEIDEQELLATFDRLRQTSDAAFRAEKGALDSELAERFGVKPEEIMPWHYADPFFQSAPAGKGGPNVDQYFAGKDIAQLSVDFYDTVGLEVRDILERSDLYERPGKMQHAFCMNVDRKGDVRILCNLKPTQRWMGTQLHELGHAVYDKYIDPGIPWLLRRPAHTMTTEAIAMLFGRLTNNAHWLTAFAGVPVAEAQAAAEYLHRQERRSQLIFSRWGMVMTHFERALYADPDQDLGKVWWDLVSGLQLVRRPEGEERATDWASKIHVANYPVYYHNYILGELTASQLQAYLEKDLGDRWMMTDEAGAWLWKRIFRPGNLLPWNDRMQQATGERLNPQHFVDQFVGE